jgi:hypothetical protein
MPEVAIGFKEDLSNVVGSPSYLENVSLQVGNKGLRCAVVSLVEAIAGNFETDLVEAAVLLDIEADLVELSDRLEDLEEVRAGKELVELDDVLVGALPKAFNGGAFTLILVEALAIAVGEPTEACHVVFDVRLIKLDLAVVLNEVEGRGVGCERN